MDILKTMGVDPKKATDGVWVVLDDLEGDHEVLETEVGDRPAIKIARADNLRYQKALTKRLQPILARGGRRGGIDPMTRLRAEAESLFETVILDWRNLAAGAEPFPFTKENVLKLWCDTTFVGFKERVALLIQDGDLFRLELEEELEKN